MKKSILLTSCCFYPYPDLGDLELRASEFLIIDAHQGQLKIQETQDLDAGDYMCIATNVAGSVSGKITLDVGCKHHGFRIKACKLCELV